MPPGTICNPIFTDEFLEQHGAAKFSSVIMTPNGFLTDEAWMEIVPKLCDGLRHQVRLAGARFGIDAATCDLLLMLLSFDGFNVHNKNLEQLVFFAKRRILALMEDRDSSEINQVIVLGVFEMTLSNVYLMRV